jgi:hypothetical protein
MGRSIAMLVAAGGAWRWWCARVWGRLMRGSAGTAGIGCIVDKWGGLLFWSQVCYPRLEYPEKLELWHNAVSS